MEAIAERNLVYERPNGEQISVSLRVGRPYKSSNVDWACPVALDGLYERLADQHGIDSFQALMLSQRLFRQLMAAATEAGCVFRRIDDESVVDLEALFARGI